MNEEKSALAIGFLSEQVKILERVFCVTMAFLHVAPVILSFVTTCTLCNRVLDSRLYINISLVILSRYQNFKLLSPSSDVCVCVSILLILFSVLFNAHMQSVLVKLKLCTNCLKRSVVL